MDANALGAFLQQVAHFDLITPKKNIFSLGGRGFYENPISDLLAFFLDPSSGHGLGDLLLSSLVECLTSWEPLPLRLEDAPKRELSVPNDGRIDLLLNGADWVIVVENKIRHDPNNPFGQYRAFVDGQPRFAGKQKYYAILAPYRVTIQGWTWVDYRDLVNKALGKLDIISTPPAEPKWPVLLREFLMAIEEETEMQMNNEEFNFAQQNYAALVDTMELRNRYLDALAAKVRQAAGLALGTETVNVRAGDWHTEGIPLQVYPARDRRHNAVLLVRPNGTFRVQFYVQENMRRAGTHQVDFAANGEFPFWGTEDAGRLWVFGPNNANSFEAALDSLRRALSILREHTL